MQETTSASSSPHKFSRALVVFVHWLTAGYWLALMVGTHWPRPPQIFHASGIDKVLHFFAFGGLAALLALCISLARPLTVKASIKIFLLVAAYAAVDELLQAPVGRTASVWDWVADLAGAAVALAGLHVAILAKGFLGGASVPRAQADQ